MPHRRLGVIGTFVWDVIYRQTPHDDRVEDWGGITYALSGLDAALSSEWELVPIMKVGADRAEGARTFLRTLSHAADESHLDVVAEKNNCSELRYYNDAERSERLTGGVPGWTWQDLGPHILDAKCDALYVNFLGGWELDLDTAQQLRTAFVGPIYVDFHMMAWSVLPDGSRQLAPVSNVDAWCRCFDFIQMNEGEMEMMASDAVSLSTLAAEQGVCCTVVTLGRRGVQYFASPTVETVARQRAGDRSAIDPAELRTGIIPPDVLRQGADADPTGCGDVWGATYFARLLAGDALGNAMRRANAAAGLNAGYRGVTGLADYLRSGQPEASA